MTERCYFDQIRPRCRRDFRGGGNWDGQLLFPLRIPEVYQEPYWERHDPDISKASVQGHGMRVTLRRPRAMLSVR